MFGPQKGMKVTDVPVYDAALRNTATLLSISGEEKGAGAAGGIGGALYSLGATRVAGIEWMLDHLKVEEKLKQANIVFTGEGQIDSQTAYGKVPAGVGELANKHNVPCFALAGQVVEPVDNLYEKITSVLSIQQGCHTLEHAIDPAVTRSQLAYSAEQVVRIWKSN